MFTNVDLEVPMKIFVPELGRVHIVLIGCGGTGSWLAPTLTRIARILIENSTKVRLTFIDPDVVEKKNVYRQNFCDAEIGRNKAETLAWRMTAAWGVEITAISEAFPVELPSGDFNFIIGCVDSFKSRLAIAKIESYRRLWWLDCGNSHSTGQVILGCIGDKPSTMFFPEGYVNYLPWPSLRHPELIEPQVEEPVVLQNISCAELALQSDQGLCVNQAVATIAGDYVVRMLLTKNLTNMETFINLGLGLMNSIPITHKSLEPWI